MTMSQLIGHAIQFDTSQRQKLNRRKILIIAIAVTAGLSTIAFGYRWWTVGRFEISTDDAYAQADSTTVAPKVSGYLSAVHVQDNQYVRAGQLLAYIDDRDFRAALAVANAS